MSNSIVRQGDQSTDPRRKLRAEAIEFFQPRVIPHPAFSDTLDAIERTHMRSGIVGTGMLLIGVPGVGKTTILNKYVERFDTNYGEKESETLTRCPIIKVSIPASPSINSLIIKILQAVGHPDLTGSKAILEARLSTFVKQQHVELLIFDEFQHFLREQAQISTRNVMNFIKTFMDDHKLAVVMSGIPEGNKAFSQYEELHQRFSYEQIELQAFSVNDNESRGYFRAYINSCRRILEDGGIKTIDLSTDNMLARICLATQGVPRLVSRLLIKTIEISDPTTTITVNDFVQAYAKSNLNRKLGQFNPFSAQPVKVRAKLEALK